ncbi:hypothetical protein PSAB6_10081 [Paraburkholderia sabiae]|nr:hypothetical protein PSAB6_10081 [Paraburkholderia sabiae]
MTVGSEPLISIVSRMQNSPEEIEYVRFISLRRAERYARPTGNRLSEGLKNPIGNVSPTS